MTPRVLAAVEELVPPGQLIVSQSVEQGRETIHRAVRDRVDVLFVGGGDGTVMLAVTELMRIAQANPGVHLPDVGILRLGTGNALAEMVSSGHYLTDLKSFLQTGHRDRIPLPLVETEGRHFPFAGLGWDAEILNDYVQLKESVGKGPFKPILQNVTGYFAAAFARTIPRKMAQAIRGDEFRARIVNAGSTAFFVDPHGNVTSEAEPGATLWEGPVRFILAGTCPYYGYGLKVLPHAAMRPDRFQIRVGTTLTIAQALAHLPAFWRGRYEGPGIVDVLVDSVDIEVTPAMPYQEGGDAMGWRERVSFRLTPGIVHLVRFI